MSRAHYFIGIILTIGLGLLSRKTSFIPLFIGDLLYAIMIYWIIRFFSPSLLKHKSALIALSICFIIEILQLLDLPIFVYAKAHPFLRLIVGQGFLWTDLLAYTGGILFAVLLDRILRK